MKYVSELLAFLTLEISRKDFFFFVSESRRSSRWTVFLNWMYVVRLFNRNALSQVQPGHSVSNLTMQLLDGCCATAKPLLSVTGEIDAEQLDCDNVQQLCIVCWRYSAEAPIASLLFWAQLSISWVPVSQFLCAQLFVNSAEIWVMASAQLKEQL